MTAREKVLRYLPIVGGVIFGLFITNPPDIVYSTFGGFTTPALYGFGLLVLLSFLASTIVSNLPDDIRREPKLELQSDTDLMAIGNAISSIGFGVAEEPQWVHMGSGADLLTYISNDGLVYAAVYRTNTTPSKLSYDFVSVLMNGRGGLTTGISPDAGNIPKPPSSFLQVIPGAAPSLALTRHREAMSFLEANGLSFSKRSAGMLFGDWISGMKAQKKYFLQSPIVLTVTTFIRILTRKNPNQYPLVEQKLVLSQIERFRASL